MATLTALRPGTYGFPVSLRKQYQNFIGGEWVAPASGQYFENPTPVTGKALCQIPRSNAADVDRALDAAHAAKRAWARTSVAERSRLLNLIAQRMEDNLELLATVETWDNGKAIRETLAADLPLAIDHFRYFAGAIRAQEGGISEIDATTVETWDNGRAIRETLAADLPLAIDHFRYFAGAIRAQEGGISEIDATTV